MHKALFASLGLALILAACGGTDTPAGEKGRGVSAPPRPAAPLTAQQLETLKATLDAMGNAQAAAREAQRPGEASETAKKMAEQLKKAQCSFKTSETSLTVSGPTCPILMRFTLVFDKTSTSAHLATSLHYEVKGAEYLKLNDVSTFIFNGEMKTVEKEGVSHANIRFGGEVLSQREGKLFLHCQGAMKKNKDGSGEGSATVSLVFPKFTAELRQTFLGKVTQYELNGVKMTREQFEALLGRAGETFPGIGG